MIPENLIDAYISSVEKTYQGTGHYKLKTLRGRKYIKICMTSIHGTAISVHSFIVMEPFDRFKLGDILKPASWAAPAKNFPRGNVFQPETYSKIAWMGI